MVSGLLRQTGEALSSLFLSLCGIVNDGLDASPLSHHLLVVRLDLDGASAADEIGNGPEDAYFLPGFFSLDGVEVLAEESQVDAMFYRPPIFLMAPLLRSSSLELGELWTSFFKLRRKTASLVS